MTMPGIWKHAVLGSWLACAPAFAADWGFDATAGVAHDDNVSNALKEEERKEDTAVTLGASAGFLEQFNRGTALGANLIVESATALGYAGLSNTGLGVRAQLRQKFGLGPEAPWVSLGVGAVHRDYHDDNRDGWQYEAILSVGRWFGDRWGLRASARYDSYVADDTQAPRIPGLSTAAYDIAGTSLGLQVTYLATEADVLAVSYSYRDGTVTAVTRPDLEVLEYSDAAVRDSAFGPGSVAYRFNAKTDSVSLNWGHQLGTGSAVNLGYTYRRSDAGSDLGAYYSNIVLLSISYSR
jgi:hypothetical protein